MSQTYSAFKKFPDARQAQSLQALLINNGIECLFINNSPRLDNTFSRSDMLQEYEVQLKPEDFERANKFLEDHARTMFDGVDEDYYLLSFSDDELYDVLVKRDEWSDFDYILAQKLLKERGNVVNEEKIQALREERLADLAKPEKNHKAWIIAGYIFALLGGFFGIITGYVISSSKKTLPNGQVVHTYTASDRAHGRIILIIGLAVLITSTIIKIFYWGE